MAGERAPIRREHGGGGAICTTPFVLDTDDDADDNADDNARTSHRLQLLRRVSLSADSRWQIRKAGAAALTRCAAQAVTMMAAIAVFEETRRMLIPVVDEQVDDRDGADNERKVVELQPARRLLRCLKRDWRTSGPQAGCKSVA